MSRVLAVAVAVVPALLLACQSGSKTQAPPPSEPAAATPAPSKPVAATKEAAGEALAKVKAETAERSKERAALALAVRVSSGNDTDVRIVEAGVRQRVAQLQACIDAARARDPKLAGPVTLRFVTENGVPQQIRVGAGGGLDACVKTIAEQMRFDSLSSESVNADVKFELPPA